MVLINKKKKDDKIQAQIQEMETKRIENERALEQDTANKKVQSDEATANLSNILKEKLNTISQLQDKKQFMDQVITLTKEERSKPEVRKILLSGRSGILNDPESFDKTIDEYKRLALKFSRQGLGDTISDDDMKSAGDVGMNPAQYQNALFGLWGAVKGAMVSAGAASTASPFAGVAKDYALQQEAAKTEAEKLKSQAELDIKKESQASLDQYRRSVIDREEKERLEKARHDKATEDLRQQEIDLKNKLSTIKGDKSKLESLVGKFRPDAMKKFYIDKMFMSPEEADVAVKKDYQMYYGGNFDVKFLNKAQAAGGITKEKNADVYPKTVIYKGKEFSVINGVFEYAPGKWGQAPKLTQ